MFSIPLPSESRANGRASGRPFAGGFTSPVTVVVAPHIVSLDMPYPPPRIELTTASDTQVSDLVRKIHQQLPKMEHDVSITTSGPEAEVLDFNTSRRVRQYLDRADGAYLELRLRIHDPALAERKDPSRETALKSRLRSALGQSEGASSSTVRAPVVGPSSEAERRFSVESAPPPYEAAVAPGARDPRTTGQ